MEKDESKPREKEKFMKWREKRELSMKKIEEKKWEKTYEDPTREN